MKHKPRISLWLEIEARCNLACRFCYNYWKDGTTSMPEVVHTSTLLSGLECIFNKFDCTQVALSGGEPLMRADFEQIVACVNRYKIPIILTTNGTMLSPAMVERLHELSIHTVQISMHSSRADEHDWLSGGPSFRQALHALMLVRARGINVVAVFVATQRNIGRFPALLRLLAMLDVRSVIFNRFIVSGSGCRNQTALGVVDDDQVLKILDAADKIAAVLGQTIFLGTPINADNSRRERLSAVVFGACPVREGQERWTIGVDGEIRRCNHSAASVGRITDGGVDRLIQFYEDTYCAGGSPVSFNPCQLELLNSFQPITIARRVSYSPTGAA